MTRYRHMQCSWESKKLCKPPSGDPVTNPGGEPVTETTEARSPSNRTLTQNRYILYEILAK